MNVMPMNYLRCLIRNVIPCTMVMLSACGDDSIKPSMLSAEDIIHTEQDKLTQVIIYDVFSPPVASRIYAYTSLAAYEAVRHASPGEESIAEKLNGFGKMPLPEKDKKYDYTLSAAHAFFTMAH